MTDNKIDLKMIWAPIKREYTERQLLYDVLGALNRAICELNLASLCCADYELNDSRFGKVVKNDVERVMKIVSDERDAIIHQIDTREKREQHE